MSKKVISVLGVLVAGLAVLATTSQGCGGGSSANAVDVCNKGCDKSKECDDLGELTIEQCKSFCTQIGSGSAGSSGNNTCGGQSTSQIAAKYEACLAMTCDKYVACQASVCSTSGTAGSSGAAGGSGAAGSSGTAGASGTAGSSGTAGATGAAGAGGGDCAATCTKAKACCVALFTQAGQATASCSAYDNVCASGGGSATQAACQQALTGGAAANIAACK